MKTILNQDIIKKEVLHEKQVKMQILDDIYSNSVDNQNFGILKHVTEEFK